MNNSILKTNDLVKDTNNLTKELISKPDIMSKPISIIGQKKLLPPSVLTAKPAIDRVEKDLTSLNKELLLYQQLI